MAEPQTLIERADTALSEVFAGWSPSTTLLASFLLLFVTYPWLTSKDPDIHPFLLQRQAVSHPVRQPGQSAVYRSSQIPLGYPLRSGLNIKDAQSPKWRPGRDGNLRDIWTEALKGPTEENGSQSSFKRSFITVLGNEQLIERSLESVNVEIGVIGNHLRQAQVKQVAICLPNSVELMASIMAAAFYGVHPILLPFGNSPDELGRCLGKVNPDALIAEAGSLQLEEMVEQSQTLAHLVLVTEPGNEHMDFSETFEESEQRVQVSVWKNLIAQTRSTVLPHPHEEELSPPSLTIVGAENDGAKSICYTSENIVASIGALLSATPRTQTIGSDDVILSVAPLTNQYPLMMIFAALFSHATIAFNSVAGDDVDIDLASATVRPTIIVAGTRPTFRLHDRLLESRRGPMMRIMDYWQRRSLLNGTMPTMPSFAVAGDFGFAKNLRLLCIYYEAGSINVPIISSSVLNSLRIALAARISYALTVPGVAGAVCQTSIYDYRQLRDPNSHFGAPLSSVELSVLGESDMVGGIEPVGKLLVRGPAVSGNGEIRLDRKAKIMTEGTVSLL